MPPAFLHSLVVCLCKALRWQPSPQTPDARGAPPFPHGGPERDCPSRNYRPQGTTVTTALVRQGGLRLPALIHAYPPSRSSGDPISKASQAHAGPRGAVWCVVRVRAVGLRNPPEPSLVGLGAISEVRAGFSQKSEPRSQRCFKVPGDFCEELRPDCAWTKQPGSPGSFSPERLLCAVLNSKSSALNPEPLNPKP